MNHYVDRTKRRLASADLKALEEFVCLLQDRKRPKIDRFIKHHPGTTPMLRSMLNGAHLLDREFRRFHREFPNVDFRQLVDMPATD